MTNSVTLLGALVRPADFKVAPGGTSIYEVTLAGERTTTDEQGDPRIKPWYVRAFALGKLADALNARQFSPGTVLYAHGVLDYTTFPLAEGAGKGSTTRVKIASLQTALGDWDVTWDHHAARLRGGVNEVELSGNLTRDAETTITGSGLLSRATLGVTTYGANQQARQGYFNLKGWRDQARPIQDLRKGAGLVAHGAVMSESYPDPTDAARTRTAVHIDVTRALRLG
ncbi:single-stranded DNA-binding protein [Deinococcus soli (ex Cha et al. 2016)]|uniref:single-stranded DNA-binding protein n=1 Tax=Deinococcus soli (ex Cha et al. 2016) TaxID=1309411 RepID=UPI00166EF640|nr:single-stranded DNA-binding protein [Deinococcus soli (ex Cha et al. 2016)]GGB73958.1 single-stranded DNA-binding protein [Deinococcus soli (ex Cha et al. 2016)]